ncbi:hypothetical protein NMR29_003675, partial [Vibrio cholerae]|nr:hypothetical protein [Vibrio cholerae]
PSLLKHLFLNSTLSFSVIRSVFNCTLVKKLSTLNCWYSNLAFFKIENKSITTLTSEEQAEIIFFINTTKPFDYRCHNARLRGWQRITPKSNTTTETTAAQWDWKRYALTVPLEAFVMLKLQQFTFEQTQE